MERRLAILVVFTMIVFLLVTVWYLIYGPPSAF